MGQRHQYIIVYPKSFFNKGNPNNKPERAEVIHHQWLYGRSAIFTLERVLRLITNSIKDGQDYMFGTNKSGYTSGDGTKAIAAAISVDPDQGYYHNTWVYEDNEGKRETYKLKDLTSNVFDNNDGITVIKFESGNMVPKYAFITPNHLEGKYWHNSDGNGPWSAKEYLDFYYNAKDQKEFPLEVREAVKRALGNIDKMAQLMSKAEVKKLLPSLNFDDWE